MSEPPYQVGHLQNLRSRKVGRPALLLADEPTGNLDPETSDEILQLLISISKEIGAAIIMATHDFIVINRYPARMLTTQNGKVFDSTSEAIAASRPEVMG